MVRTQKISPKVVLFFLFAACAHTSDATPPSAPWNPEQDPVAAVLSENQQQFRKCYNYSSELRRGTVRLAFHLSPEGEVTESRIAVTTLNNVDVETCCLAVLKRLPFPVDHDESHVRDFEYPVEFGYH